LKMHKRDVDYELLEGPEEKYIYFKIMSGEYKDVILYYYDVGISEEVEEDDVVLSFSYNIMSGHHIIEDTSKFETYLGDLFSDALINGLTDGNLEIHAGDSEQDDITITLDE